MVQALHILLVQTIKKTNKSGGYLLNGDGFNESIFSNVVTIPQPEPVPEPVNDGVAKIKITGSNEVGSTLGIQIETDDKDEINLLTVEVIINGILIMIK